MRYYFAGVYARRAELKANAERLHAAQIGAVVVSRWLESDLAAVDAGFSTENLGSPAMIARAWRYAEKDLEDLAICDAIVSFTGEGGRGGRHIEHGYAIGMREAWPGSTMAPVRLIVVGPREHVFHCHPATEVYEDFGEFLQHEMAEHLIRIIREGTSK
jgi:hypothetical protein